LSSQRAPTIKEVAHHAGVSIATVSNVVRGKDTLYTPQTAQKVWLVIRTLNYRPNHIAQSLARQYTNTLGVTVHWAHGRLTSNTYLSAMLDGFLEFATNVGYQVKIISLVADDSNYVCAQLEDGSVDGIALLAPPDDSPLLAWAQNTRIATVLAGSIPSGMKLPGVDVDDEAAMVAGTRWLIGLGHRRIGMITGLMTQWSARRREEGYLRAMRDADLPVYPEWRYEGDYKPTSGEHGAHELMTRCPDLTAIICGNDWTALGAIGALQRMGLRVPDDVSLLGFDDFDTAQWLQPPLTTIRQPIREIGIKAAEILIRQIASGTREESTTFFEGTVVQRRSVIPLREVMPTG
jgi:DNA-binding LacI/PurR family transcriptional regulator